MAGKIKRVSQGLGKKEKTKGTGFSLECRGTGLQAIRLRLEYGPQRSAGAPEGAGMQEITELERRITAALDRIGRGLDNLPAGGAPATAAAPMPPMGETAGVETGADAGANTGPLQAALEEERIAVAQLQERLKAVKEKELVIQSQLTEKIEKLTRQLDVQGLELQRMRKTSITLREQLRVLREAQAAGSAEPHLINKAMLAELDALRATRLSEMAELDELAAALDDHLTEAENA